MMTEIKRSRFLGVSAAALAGAGMAGVGLTGGKLMAAPGESPSVSPDLPARKRVLRFAHLTDIHVQRERRAGEGMAQALHHCQSLADPPEMIINGGDSVMDAFAAKIEQAREQWGLFMNTIKAECGIPVEHVLGNHDIWGWNREYSHATGDEPNYGKEMAKEYLGVDSHYRSFDRAGWRFILLDSMISDGGGYYIGQIDDEQFAWLENELKTLDPKTPVVIISHIPILSAAVFFDGDNVKGDWVVPRAWMHIDAGRLKDLFLEHSNVKLCLSGHLHLIDRVVYNDVTYICDGAVCAGWWKGPNQQCHEGYGVVDLYDDGSFEHEYVLTGWKADAS